MSENVELPAPTTEDVEAHRFMQIYDTTGEQGDEQASGAQ